ncbi:MAG: GNAT family N-acetyltransferase [Bacillota bacterium]
MYIFRRRRSGQKCKENCDAYKAAFSAAEKLHERCNELSIEATQFHSLLSVNDKGNIILGISSVNNHLVATTICDAWGQWRTVSLYLLQDRKYDRPICNMDVSYTSDYRKAHIEDWHCEYENMGYGSVLMTHLINYLKVAGFFYLTGEICPVDFNHESKLRHFYTKFGFKITDFPDRRVIKLKL